MNKLLLLVLISITFNVTAKDKAVSNVKAGLVADEDIRDICFNIATGGQDANLSRALNIVSNKYDFSEKEVREHVLTNSYCRVDGKLMSVAATAFRNEATDFKVLVKHYGVTKDFKIDVGNGPEFPLDIIMREIKARETPSDYRRVLSATRKVLLGRL